MSTSLSDFAKYPLLKVGSNHPAVATVKAILRSQGMWTGSDSTAFGPKLLGAVQLFQNTRLGPDGVYLVGDGEVGQLTWWALYNPSGAAQRSGIVSESIRARGPRLTKTRVQLLELLSQEHAKGMREIPDGANSGDGVDKIIEGFGPAPWCNLLVSWGWCQITGKWPLGKRHAHVQTFWRDAKKLGLARSKGAYAPVPGDFAVWHYAAGQGHISTVCAVDHGGDWINTYGGNEGNRLKLGKRRISAEPKLAGFIVLHEDDGLQSYALGLMAGSGEVSGVSTR